MLVPIIFVPAELVTDDVAVIVAVPGETSVNIPVVPSIVAILVSLDDQVIVPLSAVEGIALVTDAVTPDCPTVAVDDVNAIFKPVNEGNAVALT